MRDYLVNNFRHSITGRKSLNYLRIPVTNLDVNDENAHLFNKIYKWCLDNIDKTITRTPSGGISIKFTNMKGEQFDIRQTGSCIELTILILEGWFRIQFRSKPSQDDGKVIYGRLAFNQFKKDCKEKLNIDIDDYSVDNGQEINDSISRYQIKLLQRAYIGKTLANVHHIDFRSAFASGVIKDYPEFYPVYKEYFDKRRQDEYYKQILTNSIGYMHSKCCNYRFSNIAKSAVDNTNNAINDMVKELRDNGRIPLMINTDGIWYYGDIYHNDNEGDNLGNWHNDYVNCKFRAKSDGAYEFIDQDGKYHPVIRGKTRLDRVKDRSEWQWGDIFNIDAVEITYNFIKGVGIVKEGVVL